MTITTSRGRNGSRGISIARSTGSLIDGNRIRKAWFDRREKSNWWAEFVVDAIIESNQGRDYIENGRRTRLKFS
jgi:hypothetical protein